MDGITTEAKSLWFALFETRLNDTATWGPVVFSLSDLEFAASGRRTEIAWWISDDILFLLRFTTTSLLVVRFWEPVLSS